jgi:four helix bundle protein
MLKGFRTYHLAVDLYRRCEAIPAKSHLKDQLRRSALSVVLNLSEGSAKSSIKERRRFYGIAFASLRETQSLLMILGRHEELKLADSIGGCLYRLSRG